MKAFERFRRMGQSAGARRSERLSKLANQWPDWAQHAYWMGWYIGHFERVQAERAALAQKEARHG